MDVSPRIFNPTPLMIGMTGFRDPSPRAALVAKLTLDVHGDGATSIAAAQEPLSGDVTHDASDLLSYASDFVPYKTGVDVLLTGHAHAVAPAHEIDFTLGVGALQITATARSVVPTKRIPLFESFVIDPHTRQRRCVGPRAGFRALHRIITNQALDQAETFNAAPPQQRLPLLDERARVQAWNLFAHLPVVSLQLPGLHPHIYIKRGRSAVLVGMRLDTLWVDTDEAQLIMVWRSEPMNYPESVGDFYCSLGVCEQKPSWAEVEWRAATTTPMHPALPIVEDEAEDSEVSDEEENIETSPVQQAQTLVGVGQASRPLPFRRAASQTGTAIVADDLAQRLRSAALPFAPERPLTAPSPLVVPPRAAPAVELPVAPMAVAVPPPIVLEPRPPEPQSIVAPIVAPPVREVSMRVDPPPLSPVDTVEYYAELRIGMERSANGPAFLSAKGVDMAAWQRIDRSWRRRIASDAGAAKNLRLALQRLRTG